MAAKEIVFSDNARSKLVEGVNLLANAVKVTLGGIDRPAYRRGDRPRGQGRRDYRRRRQVA
jgi:hypothetical protein